MEASSPRWVLEPGMEDPSFSHQWDMSSLDHFTSQQIAVALGGDFRKSLSSESYNSCPSFNSPGSYTSKPLSCSCMEASHIGCNEKPKKILKTNSWDSFTTEHNPTLAPNASSPRFLSFGNHSNPPHLNGNIIEEAVKPKQEMGTLISHGSKRNHETIARQGRKGTINMGTKPPSYAQDHIIAERKRREKLTQRFIALTAIVPGLKKMDKATVLGDAIKYVKQLEEKVKTLEDQNVDRKIESAVLVKKSQISPDNDSSSFGKNFESLPEIEARLSGKTFLLKIHCKNHKGVLVKVLADVEKLHLTITNTSALPCMGSFLDITVVAQIEDEFSMTVKDLVKKLNSAFRKFM